MKFCTKLFDLANRNRLLLGVCSSMAQMFHVEPIIVRLICVLSLIYLEVIDNFIGTAIILYLAAYLSGLFSLWIDDDTTEKEIDTLFLAKYILKH